MTGYPPHLEAEARAVDRALRRGNRTARIVAAFDWGRTRYLREKP